MAEPEPEKKRARFAPDREQLSCTGQWCAEREKCMKYRRHAAWPSREYGAQEWASFDIERLALGGDCPAFDPINQKGARR